MRYNDDIIRTLADIIAHHDDEEVTIKVWNDYCDHSGEEPILNGDDEFEDYCERHLSYWQVAEGVADGDFRTYHSYFRYNGDFNSADSPSDLVDDDDWFSAVSDCLESQSISDFCEEYDIDTESFYRDFVSECDFDIHDEKILAKAKTIPFEDLASCDWECLKDDYFHTSDIELMEDILAEYNKIDLAKMTTTEALDALVKVAKDMADILVADIKTLKADAEVSEDSEEEPTED